MKKTVFKRSAALLFVVCMIFVTAISASAAAPKAKLIINGYKDRDVISYTYSVTHDTDSEGQLTGTAKGGKITVEVKASNDGNTELLSWMLNKNLMKDGKIDVLDPATDKTTRSIKFKDAYCVNFAENKTEGKVHTETITISCRVLNVGDASFEKDWGTKFPTGSMLSDGGLWIIVCVAVVAVAGVTSLVIVKKKKAKNSEISNEQSNS